MQPTEPRPWLGIQRWAIVDRTQRCPARARGRSPQCDPADHPLRIEPGMHHSESAAAEWSRGDIDTGNVVHRSVASSYPISRGHVRDHPDNLHGIVPGGEMPSERRSELPAVIHGPNTPPGPGGGCESRKKTIGVHSGD